MMRSNKPLMALSLLMMLISSIIMSCNSYVSIPPMVDWKLTFEDNFDSYDTSKWINHHDNGVRAIWSNKELQWYRDENVKVTGGKLQLIARKEKIFGKDPESEKFFDYTSGMICNSWSFTQPYGKWEIRVKFPFRKGFWPAFYLCPKQRPTLPEVDVFEYFGIQENSISCNLHYGIDYPGGINKDPGPPFYYVKSKELFGEFVEKWMIWSVEIYPERIIWKLDGKIVFESNEGIPTAPMYMIANVAVKDFADNNYIVDDRDMPYVMEIDYVKIYQMIPER